MSPEYDRRRHGAVDLFVGDRRGYMLWPRRTFKAAALHSDSKLPSLARRDLCLAHCAPPPRASLRLPSAECLGDAEDPHIKLLLDHSSGIRSKMRAREEVRSQTVLPACHLCSSFLLNTPFRHLPSPTPPSSSIAPFQLLLKEHKITKKIIETAKSLPV